eukprot:1657410-Amphidinium_carterae.1
MSRGLRAQARRIQNGWHPLTTTSCRLVKLTWVRTLTADAVKEMLRMDPVRETRLAQQWEA